MPETANLSTKDLRGLKKEDLVRLVVDYQNANPPSQKQRRSVGVTHDNLTKTGAPTPSQPPEGNAAVDMSVIKKIIVEAVNEIKTELRLEYMGLLKDLRNEFRQELESIRHEFDEHKKVTDSSLRNIESELLQDMREAELRKNNVMIFGLEESHGELPEDRKKADVKKLEHLASKIGVKLNESMNAIRLGRIADRPRPIKLIGLSGETRNNLLGSAVRIRTLDKSLGLDRVFIKPDLTPKQQLSSRILRSELKERRDRGERVVIRNGKITRNDQNSE